jgi:hypothetical protein
MDSSSIIIPSPPAFSDATYAMRGADIRATVTEDAAGGKQYLHRRENWEVQSKGHRMRDPHHALS